MGYFSTPDILQGDQHLLKSSSHCTAECERYSTSLGIFVPSLAAWCFHREWVTTLQ